MGVTSTTDAVGMGDDGLRGYDKLKAMVAVQPLQHNQFVQALRIPGFLIAGPMQNDPTDELIIATIVCNPGGIE